ncbi:hypothetical protein KUTeg_004679 [Tegillarca granosa]|uniref:Uncharacterized protein n=1 Tax=Tegillarca granosa TaxID=220873 RepID=A0ABQ9FKD2_TEGGR|nr:hypothetical protein KUTeg_004679 [Tegillarca granosa]
MRSRIHKEEEVKAVLEMKKDRDNAFKMLRRTGYFNVNVQRIRDAGDDADIITERKRGQCKEHAFGSLCNGVFVKAYISRHKKICKVSESNTDKPIAVPLNLVASEEKLNQNFKESVLAKFLNNDVGNTCRTDPFIIQYGQSRYKRAFSRVDKKLEVRANTMSDMRRLAAFYLCFKEEALKDNIELKSAVDLFNRPYFGYLEDALDAHTIDSNGKLKSGLRRGLAFLFLELHITGRTNCNNRGEMKKYSSLFDAAEYNCVKARHEKHRRPAELPEEREVAQNKDHLLAVINRLSSDKYKLLSSVEYNELRDCVCCRLTLFNARRGNEPSSLRLRHWDEANYKVWLTKDCENFTKNPLEKRLLQRFKLAYQSGKSVGKDVPNLIPEDCWLALEKLADSGIRAAVGVQKNN